MREDPNRTIPDSLAEAAGIHVPALGFGYMLVGLFLFPHVALVSARLSGNWRKGLLMVIMVGVITGGGLSACRLPSVFRGAEDWASWFSGTVGALWLENGRLHWQRPEHVPYQTRRAGWKVDFMPANQVFSAERLEGPERRGVWLSASQIVVWWMNMNGNVSALSLLDDISKHPNIDLSLIWPKNGRLDAPDFVPFARSLMQTMLPVLVVTEMTMLIAPVLFYTLLFTATSLLLRSPAVTGGLRAALAVNLFAGVPPMLVAAIYSGLGLPFLDYHMVFIIGFFAYLIMALNRIRRQMSSEDEP